MLYLIIGGIIGIISVIATNIHNEWEDMGDGEILGDILVFMVAGFFWPAVVFYSIIFGIGRLKRMVIKKYSK